MLQRHGSLYCFGIKTRLRPPNCPPLALWLSAFVEETLGSSSRLTVDRGGSGPTSTDNEVHASCHHTSHVPGRTFVIIGFEATHLTVSPGVGEHTKGNPSLYTWRRTFHVGGETRDGKREAIQRTIKPTCRATLMEISLPSLLVLSALSDPVYIRKASIAKTGWGTKERR